MDLSGFTLIGQLIGLLVLLALPLALVLLAVRWWRLRCRALRLECVQRLWELQRAGIVTREAFERAAAADLKDFRAGADEFPAARQRQA